MIRYGHGRENSTVLSPEKCSLSAAVKILDHAPLPGAISADENKPKSSLKLFSSLPPVDIETCCAPAVFANKKNPDQQCNHRNDDHQRPESYGIASGFLERRPKWS